MWCPYRDTILRIGIGRVLRLIEAHVRKLV